MKKNFKFMLIALLAMIGINAIATNTNWLASTKVSETAGVTYAPVGTDGKAPLVYTIITVEDNNGAGTAISKGYVSVGQNAGQMDGYTEITIPEKVTIPVTVTVSGVVKFDGTYEFTVTEVADNGFKDLNDLTSVTINAKLTKIGDNAFQGCSLSAITLPSTLVEIGASAFAETTDPVAYNKFTSVALPATLTTIGANAFEGCQLLTSVTLADNSQLNSIGDGAFSWTPLATLDLSKATKFDNGGSPKVYGMLSFGSGTSSPFTSTAHNKNAFIKKVVLPTTCAEVKANAFKSCTVLNDVDLKNVATIGTNAFEGDIALTSVVIAKSVTAGVTSVGAEAFKGCTKLATVELGKLGGAVVDDAAFSGCTALTTFKFNEITAAGAVGKKTTSSPYDLASVTTLYFQKYITAAGAVATDAFSTNAFAGTDATKQNIYYNDITVPTADADFKQPFATDAFGATGATRVITLTTVLAQFINANGFNTNADLINKVTISAGYTSDYVIGAGTDTKKLVKDKNSSFYYYYFQADKLREILRNQESGAQVTVYQAYMDVADDVASAYFMPLRVVNGKYAVATGEVVIIKSNKEDGVVASVAGAGVTSTMAYDNQTTPQTINDLEITANAVTPLEVQAGTNYMDSGNKDLWFFNNPSTSGFGFTKYDVANQTNGLAENAVFMTCAATSAARLNIVWLDEQGNTTAIQTINAKGETLNGAIYNVAGQKVDANYKGIVIKNGQKMIQK